MGSSQEKIEDSSPPDRISDLPSNIIDCIFDRIPIRDVVATSILCKEWKHKWRRMPNLVFDKEFVDDVIVRRKQGALETLKLEYCNIIGNILLLHLGPINRFVLHIPNFCNGKSTLDLSSWMLFISQNAVKEIIIEDKYTPKFRLPLYVFQCDELQHLKLDVRALDLHPPQDFRGFCNLLSLDLPVLPEGGEISKLVSKCPLLELLSVCVLDGGLPLVIDTPRLRFLHAYCLSIAIFQPKNICSVTAISLQFGDLSNLKFSQLITIFNSVPKVQTVTLQSLQKIRNMPRDPPTSIPTTLHYHRCLTLLEINISSPRCMYFVLCVLRGSPNLQKLNLGIHPLATIVDEAGLHLLNAQIMEPQTLNSLLTIKMKGLLGSEVEIMFIKLILSCSPVLKTMYLTGKDTRYSGLGKHILNEGEFTLMSELLQCPRSSSRAQVIYSRPPGDSSIFDF